MSDEQEPRNSTERTGVADFSSAFFAFCFSLRSWFFDLILPFCLTPFTWTVAVCTCVAIVVGRRGVCDSQQERVVEVSGDSSMLT